MLATLPNRISDLFGKGNGKLGDVLTFSLPAIDTCPGASGLCKGCCYATRGRYFVTRVQAALKRNWEYSKHSDFAETAVQLINNYQRKNVKIFRIHPSGDLYDAEYASKWLHIIKHTPTWTYWLYTRSWRIPEIHRVVEKIAELPNIQLWFSVDNETGRPLSLPTGVRLAYMMVDSLDEPRWEPDLFFRDNPIRGSILKHVKGTLVCPVENGASHTTCDKCRVCLTNPKQDQARRTHNRFALPIAS